MGHVLPLLDVVDQMGRRVTIPYPPHRIVSLVPSQTELLYDLGLSHRIVGVTKFCIYPPTARHTATVIGGTKNFQLDRIAVCQPHLILGNKEENYQEGIEQLASKYPVWMSNITTLAEALDMIQRVGIIVGQPHRATPIANEIANSFAALVPAPEPIPAAYFIWRQPYMVAAGGTFIDDMLARAGFQNVFGHLTRYPEITPEQLRAAAPRQILLSSEPYPFKEKHVAEFQEICPEATVRIVDGELFSWYGSRLRYSAKYFQALRVA